MVIAEIDVQKPWVEKTLVTPSTISWQIHGLRVVNGIVYFTGTTLLYDGYGDVLFMKLPVNLTVKLGYQPPLNISLEKTLLETRKIVVNTSVTPWPYNPITLSKESLGLEEYGIPQNWFTIYLETK